MGGVGGWMDEKTGGWRSIIILAPSPEQEDEVISYRRSSSAFVIPFHKIMGYYSPKYPSEGPRLTLASQVTVR